MTSSCPLPSTTLLTSLLTLKPDEIQLRLNRFASPNYTYVTGVGDRPTKNYPSLTLRCDHYGPPTANSYWKSHCGHSITFHSKTLFPEVGEGPWMVVGEMKEHNHGSKGKKSDYPKINSRSYIAKTEKTEESLKNKQDVEGGSKVMNRKGDEVFRNNMKYWDKKTKEGSSKVNTTTISEKIKSSNPFHTPKDPLNSLLSSGGSSPSVTPISPPSTSKSAAQGNSTASSPIIDSGSTTTTDSDISRLLTYGKDTSTDQNLQIKYDALYTDHESAKQQVQKLKKDNQLLIDENETNKKRIEELSDRLKDMKNQSKSSISQITSTTSDHKKCKEVENKLRNLLDKSNDKLEDLRKALEARDELDKLTEEEAQIKSNRERERKEREMEEDRRKQEDIKRKEDERKRKLKIDNEEKKLREKRRKLLDDIQKGRAQC
ncbi:hypothetical protein V866_000557 [Kwoniella sp. B9012]